MAKKQLTVEEYKAKMEKKAVKGEKFSKVFLTTIAILLSCVIVFSAVSIAFSLMGSAGKTTVVSGSNVGNSSTGGDTSVDMGGDTGLADDMSGGDATVPGDDATVPDDDATGDNTADTPAGDNGAASDTGKNANQETLDMYKKAVANARTKSKSVIRVKDGAINYKGIVEAGALSSIGSSLMGMFMAESEAAIEVKNEAWDKSKLPDASKLTLNGLQKISCVEKGNSYIVTLVAKNATNPKANADGVGSISGVIEESQITGAIGSFPALKLSNINIAYENVTAVATIDKATGNLTYLSLNSPCVLGLDAKMGPLSINGAKVGIQVITEYKIAY